MRAAEPTAPRREANPGTRYVAADCGCGSCPVCELAADEPTGGSLSRAPIHDSHEDRDAAPALGLADAPEPTEAERDFAHLREQHSTAPADDRAVTPTAVSRVAAVGGGGGWGECDVCGRRRRFFAVRSRMCAPCSAAAVEQPDLAARARGWAWSARSGDGPGLGASVDEDAPTGRREERG